MKVCVSVLFIIVLRKALRNPKQKCPDLIEFAFAAGVKIDLFVTNFTRKISKQP